MHWEIFILLSREGIRFDVTDRLWYRDKAVSINLLLNAMANPICVDDLQGTHLINNLVPFSSQNTSLSHLSYAIFVLLHFSYVQNGVSPDWPLEQWNQGCNCFPMFRTAREYIRSLRFITSESSYHVIWSQCFTALYHIYCVLKWNLFWLESVAPTP